MTDITLNTQLNDNDEQNNLKEAVRDIPTIPSTLPQSNDNDDGMVKGLVPDPYDPTKGEQARSLMGAVSTPGIFTEDSFSGSGIISKLTGAEEKAKELTQQQDNLLERSSLFFVQRRDENGKLITSPTFFRNDKSADDTLETKYRKMIRNSGDAERIFLPSLNEQNQHIHNENNQPEFFETNISREYQRYREGTPERTGAQLLQDAVSLVTGPTGAGDLKDIDERLKHLGMTNMIARTAALRAIATGRYSGTEVFRDLKDLGVMVASIPGFAADSVEFIAADLGSLLLYNLGASKEFSEKVKKGVKDLDPFDRAIKTVEDLTNSDAGSLALDLQFFIDTKAGNMYDPAIIEEVVGTRGLYNNGLRHITTEGALYATWGLFRLVRSMKTLTGFEAWYGGKYNVDNLADAMTEASKEGITPQQLVDNFIEEAYSKKAADKVRRNLDIAMGAQVVLPTKERRNLLKDQINDLNTKIEATVTRLANARAQGLTADIANHEKALKGLTKQLKTVEQGFLVPKYYVDLAGEAGLTIGAMTATNEIFTQFFGTEQSDIALVEGLSAVAISTDLGPFRIGTMARKSLSGLITAPPIILNELIEIKSIFTGKMSFAQYKKEVTSRSKNRKAIKLLENVNEQSREFQQVFMRGLEAGADRRAEIVAFNEEYNESIDPDIFSENLAMLTSIATMLDISRQLTENNVATSLGDIAETVARGTTNNSNRSLVLRQLGTGAQKFLDLGLEYNLGADHPIQILGQQMRSFVVTQSEVLKKDQEFLQGVIDLYRERTKIIAVKQPVTQLEDGGLEIVESMDASKNLEFSMALEEFRYANELSLPERKIVLDNLINKAEEINQKNLDMLETARTQLKIGEAHMGEEVKPLTVAVVTNATRIDLEVDQLYAKFDNANSNVSSDMSSFFDTFVSDENSQIYLGANRDASRAALEMADHKLIPKHKKQFASYFNASAKSTLDTVIAPALGGKGALDTLLQDLGLDELQPIEQWVRLREALRDSPEKFKSLAGPNQGETAKDIADNMPLLIRVPDWRLLNKVISRQLYNSQGERQQAYFEVFDAWQSVADPNSPTAFKRGFFGGNPANLAEEVYEEFDSVQSFYRNEVVNRREGSALTSQVLKNSLDRDIKEVVTIDDKTGKITVDYGDITKEMRDVKDKNLPTTWLPAMFRDLSKQTEGRVIGGMSRGEPLYDSFYSEFARMGGVYDEATGNFYIISKAVDPDDVTGNQVAEIGQGMSDALRGYLRGILARKNENILPKKAGTDINVFDPMGSDIVYDENLFESIFLIPKYQKNSDGSISPIINEFGEPEFLVTKEEVFEAINLDTLKRNRTDLAEPGGIFEQADNLVTKLETEALGEGGSYAKLVEQEKENILFVRKFYEKNIGESLDVSLPQQRAIAAENLYNAFVGADSANAEKMSGILMSMGYESSDVLIRELINEHIISQITTYTGSKFNAVIDGANAKLPEIELDTSKIMDLIGDPKGSLEAQSKREALRQIFGGDQKADNIIESYEFIADAVSALDQKAIRTGVKVRRTLISLDSVLSRVYNINRQVVSPQWVATETLIRASRQHGGKLLATMLTDPQIAREVLSIVQSGKVPAYKVLPDWLRVLTVQVVQAEALNEAVADSTLMGTSDSDMQSEPPLIRDTLGEPLYKRMDPSILQQNIELMENPEKLKEVAERERITPKQVEDRAMNQTMKVLQSFGFSPDYLKTLQSNESTTP